MVARPVECFLQDVNPGIAGGKGTADLPALYVDIISTLHQA